MTKVYIGPGGQNVALGYESDKWVEINAKSATIDTFKGIGNASTPVYFDENGVPQPVTSSMDDTELKKEVASIKNAVTEITEGSTAVGVAKKLANARTITLTGDASGSASFDGSENVSLNVSVSGSSSGGSSNNAADIIVDDTAGNYVATNVEDALAESATNTNNVKTRVSTLETSNTSIKSSVTSLSSNVSTLSDNVSSLSSDVSTLSTKVNNMVSNPSATTTYFYTSGTYVVPEGVTQVYVSGCAGGGGGGLCYGGGGGESVIRKVISVTPGESIAVTIGSGGSAYPTSAITVSTWKSASNGGATKFGSYLTLTGGYAAYTNTSTAKVSTWPRGGGNGATMGKSSYVQTGSDGSYAWGGGDGGSSLFGVGGTGAFFDQAAAGTSRYIAANDGVGYGAGGGGSCVSQSNGWASAAGSGSNGILIIEVA